jgi:putative tryptophan/tyrosine transport system permease protein
MTVIQAILISSVSDAVAYVLVAIGVFITLRVLGFPDLTVDGSFVTGGSIAAVLIAAGHNPFLATLAALIGGFACGAITGLLNTKLRVTALLAGVLMMVGLYSINLVIMGKPNTPLIRSITIFDMVAGFWGTTKSAMLVIYVLAAITLLTALALNWFLHTEVGLALRASGDNEQMLRSIGCDTDKNILIGCALSNGLIALGGALVAQRQGFCDVNMGIGIIVMGLACVILGEALFYPRRVATMLLAAIVGTFLYRLIIVVVLWLGLPPGLLKLMTACLVVLALAVPFIQKKIRREWTPPAARF